MVLFSFPLILFEEAAPDATGSKISKRLKHIYLRYFFIIYLRRDHKYHSQPREKERRDKNKDEFKIILLPFNFFDILSSIAGCKYLGSKPFLQTSF